MKNYLSLLIVTVICFSCVNKKKNDNPILGDELVTFIIKDLPTKYDFKNDVFISGDFEGWSGGREKFKLKKQSNSYYIDIPRYKETISFKFTKGKWGEEECQLNGNPIENRTYSFGKLKDTVKVSIKKWSDVKNQHKQSTASKNVIVFAENFQIPQLNRTRKVSVYLPPNYETSNENFPVLYMLDGQNVFDVSTSYSGEWEVDETLNKIFGETGFALIVVAIDHGEDKRLSEYSAWDNEKYGKGEGSEFLKFLVSNLKPEIDKSFRTEKEAKNTAIMGSSLGGLFTHYAAIEKPDIFGKAGVFSPSFWYAKDSYPFTKNATNIANSKLYYLAGEKEGETMVKPMREMLALMKENGFSEQNIYSKIVPEGMHSESFWKTEFEQAIKWLFNLNNSNK